MKTFTLTPALDRIAAILAAFALILLASCIPAFSQDTTSVQTGVQVDSIQQPMTKDEIKLRYALSHAITNSDTISVYVLRVIDGDTFIAVTCFDCDDAISIRVLGIDTPEKDFRPAKQLERQSRLLGVTKKEVVIAGTLVALEANKVLQGQVVKLIRDRHEKNLDKYHRPLRHVIMADGTNYAKWIKSKNYDVKK